jgi:hypothetical protein
MENSGAANLMVAATEEKGRPMEENGSFDGLHGSIHGKEKNRERRSE